MTKNGILLFGGNGFIGQAMTARLSMANRNVYVMGRDNKHTLADILPRCNTVVHLASTTTPSVSEHHPTLELDNLTSSLHLFELLQDHLNTHMVFVSSGGAIYGNPSHLPISESEKIQPLSYHGAGKGSIELFLNVLRQRIPITILRPSNVYGPHQPLRNGFGLIRHVLEHAYHGTTLTVWGDGKNTRDFIFIDDFIDVCLRFIDKPNDTDTYHVGCGQGYTLNEVIQLTSKITGANVTVEYKSARQSDVSNIILDITHVKKILNWRPHVSIEEGIRKTWQWMQINEH